MRRLALLLAAALPLAGCTLVWGPDYDRIQPDPDGSLDGGLDGGDAGDGGPDAGDGGSCVATQTAEDVDDGCRGGIDEDCDGFIDCADSDCIDTSECCGSGMAWNTDGRFDGAGWTVLPRGADADVTVDADEIAAFGPAPRALLHEAECAPLPFGLDLAVNFRIEAPCGSGCDDFASLALTPTRDMADGARLTADLALVVEGDGTAHLEQAGTEVPGTEVDGLPTTGGLIRGELKLRPGTFEGGAVLRVTASVSFGGSSMRLGPPHQPLLLLDDLMGPPFCPGTDIEGQLVAIEGRGDIVQVVALDAAGPVTVGGTQRSCANPSYFEPLELRNYEDSFAACYPGNWGEPSLVSYCLDCDPVETPYWDLWIDTAETGRGNILEGYTDFAICGSRTSSLTATSTSWEERTNGPGPPVLPMEMGESAREPFVWTPPRAANNDRLVVAWAQRAAPDQPAHDLHLGMLLLGYPEDNFGGTDGVVLAHGDVDGCESLRDPALMPGDPGSDSDPMPERLWLFFTCDAPGAELDSIGAAALVWEGSSYVRDDTVPVRTDVLTRNDLGDYAVRGPFAPEPVAEFEAGALRVNLWFFVRTTGSGAPVALAFATGDGVAGGELPPMRPYPANPILRPDDEIFDNDCPSTCRFNGVGIARSFTTRDYQMVLGRTVVGDSGETHELVPLRQRRPNL
jgi:hypothetical protein